MTSANLVSPSNQMAWLTTNSRFGDWNIFTWRFVLFMVGISEPPYLNIIRTGA